jgi:hypothetical protein
MPLLTSINIATLFRPGRYPVSRSRVWVDSGRSTGTVVSTSGPRRESMTLSKEARGLGMPWLGMPWEDLYG